VQLRWGGRWSRQCLQLQLGGADRDNVAWPDWLAPADPLPVKEGSIGGGKILHDELLADQVEPGVPAGQRRVVAEPAGRAGGAAEQQAAGRDFDPAAAHWPGQDKQGRRQVGAAGGGSHDISVLMGPPGDRPALGPAAWRRWI
jgi:hypothetical protein